MSPTRRDALKTMIAMPVVALLPANVEASQSPSPEPIHLNGMAIMWPVEAPVRSYSIWELYVDDRKTIIRVRASEALDEFHVAMWRNPQVVAAFRILSEMMQGNWGDEA